jgi:DNA mismatch repair protein MutL
MVIQVLPDDVVAQIAAGEVVERPASVVKELIENALDAGALAVHVEVVQGGRRLIRISDNGCGISPSEVELAFSRHATSKLRSAEDLVQIQTLGFRGEALSSIASVSRTLLVTRQQDEALGTRIQLEGGVVQQRQSVGAPAGTVISVENLFFNTPARLKFMKKENTEKRHITKIITHYAMAYPHVRFVLEQDGREVFRSSGSGQLADVVIKALGLENFKNMVEVAGEESADGATISVFGYTSMPSFHRTDRSRIILFINGRAVQDSSLTYAVVQAYHTLLMKGRYPVAVLMVELPLEDVDVNVHPTKAEVRFRNSNAVFVAIQRAVRTAVIGQSQLPHVRTGYAPTETTTPSTTGWDVGSQATQLDMDLSLEGAGHYPRQQPAVDDQYAENDPTAIPVGPGTPDKPRTLPVLRVVGQVGAMYIVAEGPVGMYLIDQHAAHERILYEQFMEEYARQETIAQHALTAQTIDLAPDEARLVEGNLDLLRTLGFELESFGPNTFAIRSVPALLADRDLLDVVAGVVEDLEQGKNPVTSLSKKKLSYGCANRPLSKPGKS